MKVLTSEEEKAHSGVVITAGIKAGTLGTLLGLGGVWAASRRYGGFRSLTLPFKAFLVTSSGTAFSIIAADHASINFERQGNSKVRDFADATARAQEDARRNATAWERGMEWGRVNRYRIVGVSWLAGMAASWHWVGRDRYMTMAQKVVQARVYAQGLTLLVLIATAAFEMNDARNGEGRWETIMVVDPEDPEQKHLIEKRIHREEYAGQDLWKEMVAAEERRLAERKKRAEEDARAGVEARAEAKA